MYGFTERREGWGLLLFRFDNLNRAIDALLHEGINPVRSVDLFEIAPA
jgi:hypothetical protein